MSDRQKVLKLIQRHGWNATAFQTLETGYHYFFYGNDACIAYIDTGRAWVAAGAPIAAAATLDTAVRAFISEARMRGKRCGFFAIEDRLRLATTDVLQTLRIGEQPVWDPRTWPTIVARHSSLRAQLNRARNKGVRIRKLSVAELAYGETQHAMRQVINRWLASRPLAPMDFLVRVEPFAFAEERSCFVAEVENRLVGFAGVIPIPARGGWFIEDLVRDSTAPNGTNEALIDAVMRSTADQNCTWLTLGLAPLAGELNFPLRVARRTAAPLYNFDGLLTFKAKFCPTAWLPIYMAFPRTQGPLVSLVDALVAFAEGSFVHFGIRSLRRGLVSARFYPRSSAV